MENKEAATEKFKAISEAYSVLSNEERRAYYDKHGFTKEDAEDGGFGFPDMDDIFSAMFGKGGMSFSFSTNLDDDEGFEQFINILEGNDQR